MTDHAPMICCRSHAVDAHLIDVELLRKAIHWSGMVLVDQVTGKPVDDAEATLLRYTRLASEPSIPPLHFHTDERGLTGGSRVDRPCRDNHPEAALPVEEGERP